MSTCFISFGETQGIFPSQNSGWDLDGVPPPLTSTSSDNVLVGKLFSFL